MRRRLNVDDREIPLSGQRDTYIYGPGKTKKSTTNIHQGDKHVHYHGSNGGYWDTNDPYYWGSDWVWCTVILAVFALFFVFILILSLTSWGTCDNRCCDSYGNCYCCNGSYSYHSHPFSMDAGEHVNDYQYVRDSVNAMEKRINETLHQKAQDCPVGMHPWVYITEERQTNAMCVINQHDTVAYDAEIMIQDDKEATEMACSDFSFEEFVCRGWYDEHVDFLGHKRRDKDAIPEDIRRYIKGSGTVLERTFSAFTSPNTKDLFESVFHRSAEGLFHRSRSFSQLSYMNQKLLKQVMQQINSFSETGWFNDSHIDPENTQMEKLVFRNLITSCVNSLYSQQDIYRNGPPQDFELFVQRVSEVVEPMVMGTGRYERYRSESSEWNVGRAFGRAHCLGIAPILHLQTRANFMDRTEPILLILAQRPLVFVAQYSKDTRDKLIQTYCNVVSEFPWYNLGDENSIDSEQCATKMKRMISAFDVWNRLEHTNEQHEKVSIRPEFWQGFVWGMGENIQGNEDGYGCIKDTHATKLNNVAKHILNPYEDTETLRNVVSFYQAALNPNPKEHEILQIKDYEKTWKLFLEVCMVADYIEYVDFERVEAATSPGFAVMYGHDIESGLHSDQEHFEHSKTQDTVKRLRKNASNLKDAVKEEYKFIMKPWVRGHHRYISHILKRNNVTNSEVIDRMFVDHTEYHSETSRRTQRWSSMINHWANGTNSRRSEEQYDTTSEEYVDPQRGIVQKQKTTDKWPVCTQMAAMYLPNVIDNAFASTALSKQDIDLVASTTKRILKEFSRSMEKSSVLSKHAKEKLKEKVDAMAIRIAVPWNRADISPETPGSVVPPILESYMGTPLSVKGASLWSDIAAIRRYALRNNMNAAFDPVNTPQERRDRMAFDSAGMVHFGMPTSAVNAYYSPTENSINILAGIMGSPFHRKEYTAQSRFASIGAVIGHEIAHGFDSSGVHFDQQGSFVFPESKIVSEIIGSDKEAEEWLTSQDMEAYADRQTCFVEKYTTQTRLGNINDGEKTLGENIADTMGLKMTLNAMVTEHNQNQRSTVSQYPKKEIMREFLQSYGQLWCVDQTKEQEQHKIDNDVHSPGGTRINGAISSLYFSTEDDPLYVAYGCRRDLKHQNNPKIQRCSLW